MTTINDILYRMPKGYNIAVYNTISGRFIDDFIWDGEFTGCKLDIKYTHYTDIDKVEFLTDVDGCSIINFYIFDYAHIKDIMKYCYNQKIKYYSDKTVNLIVVTKDNNIDTYEVNTDLNEFYTADNFGRICEEKYRKFYYRNDEMLISKFITFKSNDGGLNVMIFL